MLIGKYACDLRKNQGALRGVLLSILMFDWAQNAATKSEMRLRYTTPKNTEQMIEC